MNDKTYNGWTNYETWLVALWFDNDSSEYWAEEAQTVFDSAEADSSFTKAEQATFTLADSMKAQIEEAQPEVTGMWADLINSAMSEVNWHEIAKHYIDDIEPEEA